jgi:uncharacterized protein (TIGR02266 family)
MGEERRKSARARVSDIRVTYESAAGDQVEASARDIGRGGVFIRVATPLAVGKRISLEIQIQGEPAPWSALGRVVWTREKADGAERPPGMGVKLIDVEDVVLTGIDGLIARSPPLKGPPLREKTIIGVGSPQAAPAAAASPAPGVPRAPSVPVAATEERTVEAPFVPHARDATREASVVIDLVAKSEPSVAYEDSNPPHPWEEPAGARRKGGRWLVVAVLLLIAAGAVYAFLVGDFDRALRSWEPPPVSRPPVPLPTTPVALAPAPTPVATPAPTPMPAPATAAASASGSARVPAASASTAAEPKRLPVVAPPHPTWRVAPPPAPTAPPARAAPSAPSAPSLPASGGKKPGTEDNPY